MTKARVRGLVILTAAEGGERPEYPLGLFSLEVSFLTMGGTLRNFLGCGYDGRNRTKTGRQNR